MFTGITRLKAPATIRMQDGLRQITVDLAGYGEEISLGASVAINGVCLTVVSIKGSHLTFDVATETAQITNLGDIQDGDLVNIERSYRVGDEIGGHILSGHVADCVEVVAMKRSDTEARLSFLVPDQWCRYLMPKGFVALNGCSLTVADYDRSQGLGSVNLIPETLRQTNFDTVKEGDFLNLEVDSQTQTIVDTVTELLSDKEWIESVNE